MCATLRTLCVAAFLAGFPLPAPAGTGTRPGAGNVQAVPGQVVAPAADLVEITHDPVRGVLWCAFSSAPAGAPNLRCVHPVTLAPQPLSVITDEMDGGGPPGPDIDGPVNGLAILANGNLLCSDLRGDGSRFPDTLFEVDPSAPALVNFWYLNDQNCASACRANTNTDVPKRNLWDVAALTASRASPGTGPLFVTRAINNRGSTVLTRVALVPGQPGTWSLLQDVPAPCGAPPTGLAFDPDQAAQNGLDNVYWMTAAGNHGVYECTWDALRRRFEVNQVLPAPFFAGPATSNRVDTCVAPRLGTASPHVLILGEGSATAASNVLVPVDAGTGAPDAPAQEFALYHSTLSTNLYNATDPVVFNEEVQLWRPGRTGNTSEWTREHAAILVFPPAIALDPNVLSDVDALTLDPNFSGADPTFFDFYWSDRVDQPLAEGGPILNGDIVRIRRDCSQEFLIREAEILSVLGIPPGTAINTDAVAILSNGDLLVSLSETSVATTSPNFPGGAILDGDVLAIPAARAPGSGYWAYREAEWGGFIANAIGAAFSYSELDGLDVDPAGNPARPNPNQANTTRPDVLFTVDYTATSGTPSGWRTNHVFSTRAGGAGNGAVARDARDLGYGAVGGLAGGILVDALAVSRRDVGLTPVADVHVQTVPSRPGALQTLRLLTRNLPPGDLNVFIFGQRRMCPTMDVRPYGFRGYPLCVVPDFFLPTLADGNGLLEFTVDFETGVGVEFYVQPCSSEAIWIGPVTKFRLL